MNNFEKIKAMSINQLVDWLDENGHHDAIWWKWFEEAYCKKCPMETVMVPHHVGEETYYTHCASTYCAEHDNCCFFPELKDVPDSKETIKIWLESETTDEEV